MFSEVFKWFSSNLHMPVPKIQRLKIEEQFSVLLQNEKELLDKYQNPVGKLGGHNTYYNSEDWPTAFFGRLGAGKYFFM